MTSIATAATSVRLLTSDEVDAVAGAAVALPRLTFSNDAATMLRKELVDFIKKSRTALPEAPGGFAGP